MANQLEYIKVKMQLKCLEDARLPGYLGSTLRGALGNEIKKLSCTSIGKMECRGCESAKACCYVKVFSSIDIEHGGWLKGTDTVPNPYIIEPPEDGKRMYTAGDILEFNLILVGSAVGYLQYFIYAVNSMARNGLGMDKKRFFLENVKDFTTQQDIYSNGIFNPVGVNKITWSDVEAVNATKELRIRFTTPFRFRTDGRVNDSLNFEIFMRNILRRMSMFSACYCGTPWELDYADFLEKTRDIAVRKADLEWHDWERYSSRMKSKLKMGGIVGEIVFKGKLDAFMPYVEIGSKLHVGKGCTMGLGKYSVEVTDRR